MNETNRFFKLVNRINSVLLLIVIVMVGVGMTMFFVSESSWGRRRTFEVQGTTDQGTTEKISLRLGCIEEIYGLPVQFVRVESEGGGGKLSSGGYHDVTRNILFLSKDLKEARWLFPNHAFAITALDQIREKEGSEEEERGPTQAIYYEIVKQDSNGDGKLLADDHAVVAFSKADGSGYVEVISDAQRIIGHQSINQGTEVAVLLERDAKILYQSYSVAKFSKTSETLVTEILTKP